MGAKGVQETPTRTNGPIDTLDNASQPCVDAKGVQEIPTRTNGPIDTLANASWAAMAGVDIRVIKEWLGHNCIQTTMRYAA